MRLAGEASKAGVRQRAERLGQERGRPRLVVGCGNCGRFTFMSLGTDPERDLPRASRSTPL